MSYVVFAADIESGDQTIEHGMGTTDLTVAVWQNGHSVNPSVYIVDENTVKVYGVPQGRLVLGGVSTKRKSSGTKQGKPS